MKLTTIRILAAKFDETVGFYRDVMQIPIRADAGVYVAFDVGGFELGVYRRELMTEIVSSIPDARSTSDSLLINIEVGDLGETVESLRSRGAEFETAVQDQSAWGMRVIHMRDPEGNLLELYEVLRQS